MKKLLCLCLLLCACSPDDSVMGKTYQLSDSPLPITLSFNAHDTTYFGTAINHYFGTYNYDKDHITFTTLSSGLHSASDSDLDAEDSYFTTLKSVQTYQLTGRTLRLITHTGTTLLFHEQSPTF